MTTWVYKRTEPQLWTVGYYTPDDTWEPESDHGSADEAAARVRYLNGGPAGDLDVELRLEEVTAHRDQLRHDLVELQAEHAKTCSNFDDFAASALETTQQLRTVEADMVSMHSKLIEALGIDPESGRLPSVPGDGGPADPGVG